MVKKVTSKSKSSKVHVGDGECRQRITRSAKHKRIGQKALSRSVITKKAYKFSSKSYITTGTGPDNKKDVI